MRVAYRFSFESGREETVVVSFDSDTALQDMRNLPQELPGWTDLEQGQCSHCSLDVEQHKACPAARSLVDVVKRFGDVDSHQSVVLRVVMPERKVVNATTVQRGLGSLVGLLLATSGCPHLGFFRPMARFHLPLSSEEDTAMRAVGMYLIGRYLGHGKDQDLGLSLAGLRELYRNLEIVNSSIALRLRGAAENDASVNAVIFLDMFAKSMPFILEDKLQDLRPLFSAYL